MKRGTPLRARLGEHQAAVGELEDDPLPDPPYGDHTPALRRRDRRNRGAQNKWRNQPHSLKRLADDVALERIDVDLDVWKLWHHSFPPALRGGFAAFFDPSRAASCLTAGKAVPRARRAVANARTAPRTRA